MTDSETNSAQPNAAAPNQPGQARAHPQRIIEAPSKKRALGTFLGVCGLVVFLSSSTGGLYFFGYESWLTLGPIAFSLVAMAGWLILSYEKLTERLSQRAAQYLGLTVGYTVALAAATGGVHYMLAQQPVEWDLTDSGLHSLSEQSLKVVQNLKHPVQITAFYEQGDPELGVFEAYADRYRRVTDRVTFRVKSPSYDIEDVRKYKITAESPPIVVETNWEDPLKRQEARFRVDMQSLNHEETFTNAIIGATLAKKKRIYVITGHGESEVTDPGPKGFKEAAVDLRNEGYDVIPLSFMVVQKVPDDASLLILPGPDQPLLPPEVAQLRGYLDSGGRLLALLDANKDHGLDSLIGSFGIQANSDVIIDISPFGRLYGDKSAIATNYGAHPITDKFGNAMTIFPEARSLSLNPGTQAHSMALIKSGEKTWGETDFAALAEGRTVQWNAGEARGPVTVAVATELQVTPPPKKPGDPPEVRSRLVVVGDSSFATNEHRKLGANRNLLLNAAGWLTEQEDKIAIRPKSRGGNLIVLSPKQREGIAFFVLYVLPVTLLSVGLGIWLVRRQR